jgi:hypothetical protein
VSPYSTRTYVDAGGSGPSGFFGVALFVLRGDARLLTSDLTLPGIVLAWSHGRLGDIEGLSLECSREGPNSCLGSQEL